MVLYPDVSVLYSEQVSVFHSAFLCCFVFVYFVLFCSAPVQSVSVMHYKHMKIVLVTLSFSSLHCVASLCQYFSSSSMLHPFSSV